MAASGGGGLDITTKAVTLDAGPTARLGAKGTASVVVHAAADDEKADPTGNAGASIAGG